MPIVLAVLFLAIATIVVSGLIYIFTGDRRYLRLTVQVAKVLIFVVVGFMIFYVLERLLLVL